MIKMKPIAKVVRYPYSTRLAVTIPSCEPDGVRYTVYVEADASQTAGGIVAAVREALAEAGRLVRVELPPNPAVYQDPETDPDLECTRIWYVPLQERKEESDA